MKKLFKKIAEYLTVGELYNSSTITSKNTSKLTKEDMNKIIQEIHATFYSEVDRLLEDCKTAKSTESKYGELIEKAERLKKLGFINTKEVQETEQEILRLDKIKKENESKKELFETINYFKTKYPQYKFITEESVKNICRKYNLVYGSIDKYIGSVPNKNLTNIENFKIEDEDCCYNGSNFITSSHNKYISYDDLLKKYYYYDNDESANYVANINKFRMEIVAPLKYFKMKDSEILSFKVSDIEIPDPIVLHPVMMKNGKTRFDNKYYLIVTAWGDETA